MSDDAPQELRDPSVWRADEIGGKAGLSRRLDRAESDAIAEMLGATRDRELFALRPDDFRHPALEDLTAACRRELVQGRGVVILTGLDSDRLPLEDYHRVYWFLGQLIGRPMPQSEKGDLIGYVRQEPPGPVPRGYTSNVEIGFHTDFHEILSLASVQTASEGGESGLVSSGYIHNVMLAECPDLLRALYRGWYDGLEAFWFQRPTPKERLSDELVPYFSAVDGKMSFQNSLFGYPGQDERVAPADLGEAQAAMAEIAARPGVAARFLLQPGEMVFWHNYTVMHARTEFRDAPGRERLLMRLWLHAHEKRPTPAAVTDRVVAVDRMIGELRQRAKATEEA